MSARTCLSGLIALGLAGLFGAAGPAGRAVFHCDGLDGPVVKAAQRALDTGEINAVLAWISAKDEAEVRTAFKQALTVREGGPVAKQLADRFFFETVVRIHRIGEGASFTGLKPAGRDLGPAIPAADAAISDGSSEALSKLLADAVHAGVRERFQEVTKRRRHAPDDVEAGRLYVHAYVAFVHYAEKVYAAAKADAHGHFAEEEGGGEHR
ncbi:MAG TPA: DUF6448 family protein [Planctomycetota bacterium]|nr:DUF6448 family protein [Planctomycetota bacterium]